MNTVTFDKVSKKHGGFTINDMSFTIPEGYITGFIGPNGRGKTTAIQILIDIVHPDDFNIKKMKDFIAPLYNDWNEELYNHYLEQFELPYKKKLKKFSKGMKMKCSLLFALAHEPDFLIMDEPTAGLDPIFRRELLGL